jgi:hypothetical protein
MEPIHGGKVGQVAPPSGYDYRGDPILGPVLAYWCAKRGNRSMPARRDIDPAELPTLLPHLQLIDIVDGRYRYRLVGSELVYAYGSDYTRRYADEFFEGTRAASIIEVYGIVRDARQSVFLRSRYLTSRDTSLIANRLYLPLSTDGHDVNMILGALTFEHDATAPIAGAWGNEARLDGSHLEVLDAG